MPTQHVERPTLLLSPHDSSTTIGDEVVLTCIFRGCPNPNVTWYHNSDVVIGDSRRRYHQQQSPSLTSCTLTITSVHEDDLGTYECVGSNMGGSSKSDQVMLKLSNAPSSSTVGKRSVDNAEDSLCSSKSSPDTGKCFNPNLMS